MPHLTIRQIDTGKVIHRNWYASTFDSWGQVCELIAERYECSVDDVNCGESDDGDTIEIHGKAVALLDWEYRRVELRRPIYAEAAE